MQPFWIKFLIILSSALSVQSALAVSLSALLNVNQTAPSLLVGSVTHQELTLDVRINNPINNTDVHSAKLSRNLSELLQHKIYIQFCTELQQSINLNNEPREALVNLWINAFYNQSLQQQGSVYNAIKAQQNSCFKSQNSYQAQRQKISLHISQFN